MRQAIIHNLPGFLVTSHGNGLAYEVVNRRENAYLFFQDSDAYYFREQLRQLTEIGPRLDYEDALTCLWNDYADFAKPMKILQ